MIKQILFDCGGVLVELNFRSLIEKISGSSEIAEDFIRRLWHPDSPWLLHDSGELNASQVRLALLDYMPAAYRTYILEFTDSWLDALPPMKGMDGLVGELKNCGYPCYLLSNFSECFQQMPARTPVLQKMDGMVISYDVHMIKPDPEIFRYTLRKFGLKAEETLFVDDNALNVEAARTIGLEAFHFTTPDALRGFLQDRGIITSLEVTE